MFFQVSLARRIRNARDRAFVLAALGGCCLVLPIAAPISQVNSRTVAEKYKSAPVAAQPANAKSAAATTAAAPQPNDAIRPLANEYRLGAQDKIRVSVFEKRVGEYHEWAALNGEFELDPSGALFLPLAGVIDAQHMSTSELAYAIAVRVQQNAGLAKRPDVSVMVTRYRPFYLVGDVQQPGEFPYRPGLTTMKALAIAGGLFRDAGGGGALRRNTEIAKGALRQAGLELRRMFVRRVRLSEELTLVDSNDVAMLGSDINLDRPRELALDAQIDTLLLDEERIMHARVNGLRSQISRQNELIALLRDEGRAIKKKIDSRRKQYDLALAENAKIEKLWKKKLVVSTRRLNMQRTLAELEGHILDLESAYLRVQQDLSKAERDIFDARAKMIAEITAEMQQVEAQIEVLRSNAVTQQTLIATAPAPITRVSNGKGDPVEAGDTHRVIYSITRKVGHGPATTFETDEDAVVLPGDVVRISVVATDTSIMGVSNGMPNIPGIPGVTPARDGVPGVETRTKVTPAGTTRAVAAKKPGGVAIPVNTSSEPPIPARP